jgi:ribonuclease P protein component
MKEHSFPKRKRLVSNRQFKSVLAGGVGRSNGLLTLYMAENECGYPRLGVSVGKSCGNAVARNRLKRLIREAFRQNQDRIPAKFDYVVLISPKYSRRLKGSSEAKELVKQLSSEKVQGSFMTLVSDLKVMVGRSSGAISAEPGAPQITPDNNSRAEK